MKLAVACAACLTTALVLDLTGHSRAVSGPFIIAGLVFLVAAILFPHPHRHPDRRLPVDEIPQHPAVTHAVHLRRQQHREGMGPVGKANDWLATHLAIVFGVCWTIWVFFAWPLAAQFFSPLIQAKTSYYAQSWIQLFALPLMVYVGNKLQRSSDAQSEVIHQALTHIATVSDQNKVLIEQNTELTTQIHALVNQPVKRLATSAERSSKGKGASA